MPPTFQVKGLSYSALPAQLRQCMSDEGLIFRQAPPGRDRAACAGPERSSKLFEVLIRPRDNCGLCGLTGYRLYVAFPSGAVDVMASIAWVGPGALVRKGMPSRTRHTGSESASVKVDIGIRTSDSMDNIHTDDPLS